MAFLDKIKQMVGLAPHQPATRFALGTDKRLYAIGDIHGRLDLLQALHDKIIEDARGFTGHKIIVYLGDYIDRGQDSAKTLDALIDNPMEKDFTAHYLLGNHEWSLLESVHGNNKQFLNWLHYGGIETIQSYGIDALDYINRGGLQELLDALKTTLPKSHLAFIKALKLYHEEDDYFFVHAGVDPSKPLHLQEEWTMLTVREPFLSHDKPLDRMVVHGHTISPEPDVTPHRIGIDTGAYNSNKLTALVLEGTQKRFIHS